MKYLFSILFLISTLRFFSQNEVKYFWSGAITYQSAQVNAKMSFASDSIRLAVNEDSSFINSFYSNYTKVDSTTNYMVPLQIKNLSPLTKYFYAIESNGILDSSAEDVGSFTTFANGAFSFSFAIGSCAENSNHKVFEIIKNKLPNFYMNMGDLHYSNPNSAADINVHRLPYENAVLSKPNLVALLQTVPNVYMWDDHDFCGNNSDGTFEGKQNARRAYHEYVPHYPLAFGSGVNHPIAQAFTVGRVHFILTDLRSERTPNHIISEAQLDWFENECLYAKDNHLIVAWMSTYSWSGVQPDNWAGFATTRAEINNFLYCNNVTNLFILSGDAHMLGIDDGQNGNFATFNCPTTYYPNFQAAALNAPGSYKGGTYNQGGYFINPNASFGQFGMVDVKDFGGDSICISFSGYRTDSTGTTTTLLNNFEFCRDLSITDIQENFLDADVTITPNPASRLTLFFKQKTNLKSIKIYSMLGSLVVSVNPNVFVNDYSFPSNSIQAGAYIVKIDTAKGTIKKYWIKN